MQLFKVECKKAQPKEVMLPANIAKTRTIGRNAYGEFLVIEHAGLPAPSTTATGNANALSNLATNPIFVNAAAAAAATAGTTTFRYTPYPLPALHTANLMPITLPANPLAPSSSILQYSPTTAFYDITQTSGTNTNTNTSGTTTPTARRVVFRPFVTPPTLAYVNDLLSIYQT